MNVLNILNTIVDNESEVEEALEPAEESLGRMDNNLLKLYS